MRLPLIIASIVCSLLFTGAAEAAPLKKPGSSRKLGLTIRVEGDGWGRVSRESIETVLYAVADELMYRLPKKLSVPVVVSHTEGNPVALYERGPGGEYRVLLHASGPNWHLYAYEFAHELCHVLSNYEENAGADPLRYNQWFEEALCETASLYTLKSLAETWEESPPAPGWSVHTAKLRRFFDLLIAEGHRQLPEDTPLAAWLRQHEERLRRDPYQRAKNEVVANLLLPLFARNPENWDALTYLNLEPNDARNTLRDYLHHWYDNAPRQHRAFIADVLGLLQLRDVVTVTADSGSGATAAEAGPGKSGPRAQ